VAVVPGTSALATTSAQRTIGTSASRGRGTHH
jgi:hypothetical protein